MPQLFLWVVRSTQDEPHCVKPVRQPLELHMPFEQTWVPVHMRPQTPQFIPSEATQVPLHSMKPLGHAHINFNPRFYLVALIFVIFEVEIALIYPVASVYRSAIESGAGVTAFLSIAAFVLVLAAGLVVVWARGDFDWVRALQRVEPKNTVSEELKRAA